ncbi:hypothetical protein [uncultured Sulfitobacter sp.]|uniref:hypothetical protein n=1 Tax=uncultured Sulfitobacter sp. TaxID=191468 RepID=UPI0026137143|nr:hypothetical protein [uncultured Sulfitobacter sp.]
MLVLLISLLAIGLANIAVIVLGSGDFSAIDKCLDRGGSWDYDTQNCYFGN